MTVCSCREKKGAELHIYLEEGTYHKRLYLEEGTCHKRLFRGPSTNDMKKYDGPSRSWPTPHTTPISPPPKTPPVLLRPNSTPNGDPTPLPPGGRSRRRRGRDKLISQLLSRGRKVPAPSPAPGPPPPPPAPAPRRPGGGRGAPRGPPGGGVLTARV